MHSVALGFGGGSPQPLQNPLFLVVEAPFHHSLRTESPQDPCACIPLRPKLAVTGPHMQAWVQLQRGQCRHVLTFACIIAPLLKGIAFLPLGGLPNHLLGLACLQATCRWGLMSKACQGYAHLVVSLAGCRDGQMYSEQSCCACSPLALHAKSFRFQPCFAGGSAPETTSPQPLWVHFLCRKCPRRVCSYPSSVPLDS